MFWRLKKVVSVIWCIQDSTTQWAYLREATVTETTTKRKYYNSNRLCLLRDGLGTPTQWRHVKAPTDIKWNLKKCIKFSKFAQMAWFHFQFWSPKFPGPLYPPKGWMPHIPSPIMKTTWSTTTCQSLKGNQIKGLNMIQSQLFIRTRDYLAWHPKTWKVLLQQNQRCFYK